MSHAAVYTLTPNPALDLSGHVRDLVPNEKNYVQGERRDPGGNGINAARVAARLGARVLALGFLGGASGDEIRRLMAREGVPARFTPIRGQTRVNVTVTDLGHHRQTRLTFHGPRVSGAEIRELLREVGRLAAPGILVIGGSLPEGCPKGFHESVARAACSAGVGVVLDVPARFFGSALGPGKVRPLLVKPNQVELEEWCGHRLKSDSAVVAAAREMARYSELVCVSLAERGALLVSESGAWFARAPRVKARGTVGAGDSMVGAMTAEMARQGLVSGAAIHAAFGSGAGLPPSLQRALKTGVAAGAATAEAVGTAHASAREIRRLRGKVRIETRA